MMPLAVRYDSIMCAVNHAPAIARTRRSVIHTFNCPLEALNHAPPHSRIGRVTQARMTTTLILNYL